MKRAPRESDIYSELSKFMRLKYPTLIWRFDFSAGTKMTIGQARIHKAFNPHRGYPDLFICRPSNGYAGLFIEIKQQGVKVAKLDGSPLANEHLAEQAQIIEQLRREGYYATFGCGLIECVEIIEKYLR